MANFKFDVGFWKNGILAGVIASFVAPYFTSVFGFGLLALIGFIIWVARELFSQPQWVTFVFKKVIKNYKDNLAKKYGKIENGFHQNESLSINDAYIPIKFSSNDSSIDFYEEILAKPILAKKKSLILGKAGSGKTVFLQHLLSSYIQGKWDNLSHLPIPVFVELKTLEFSFDKIEASLQECLSNELTHDNTNDEEANDFLLRTLKNGQLILLFNGLDEVKIDPKKEVKNLINLLKKDSYKRCHVIFTCRLEAWEQFKELFFSYQKIEIKPFDDSQIRQFLSNSWQMPKDRSVAEFLDLLKNNVPKIKILAQNPLLLTLLVYDYTHPENRNVSFVLPNSRVEFYERATEKLFRQEHRSKHQHHIGYHQVLQQLAFVSHVAHGAVLTEQKTEQSVIKAYKNSGFREPSSKEINLLLKAIRESGLLLYEDGKYKFAHSTLIEFYVAKKFESDGENLLEHFKNDPNNWEEIVKLWCELVEDSTPLIENIYETHKEIAFECLVNSQHVNREIAKDIITIAKDEFKHVVEGKTKPKEKTKQVDEKTKIVRAFGVVAADQNKDYGKEIFSFLADILRQTPLYVSDNNKQQITILLKNAAYALSMTSQRKAADLLVKYYFEVYGTCPYLGNMGEIAVLSLQARIKEVYHEYKNTPEEGKKNKEKTLTNLFGMLAQLAKSGNDQATEFLIDCLWNDGLTKWYIEKFASLFSHANIIKVMRKYPIKNCQNVEELSWIWKPFAAQESEGSCLPRIAGRVAYLLSNVERKLDKEEKLDPRLIVPLCAIHLLEEETKLLNANKKYIQYLLSKPTSFLSENNKIDDALDILKPSEKWKNLFNKLKSNCQYELLLRLVLGKRIPDKNDWGNNIIHSDDYKFKTGWHYKGIRYIAQAVSLSSFAVMLLSLFILGINHPFIISGIVVASIMLFSGWYLFWREPLFFENKEDENALTYYLLFLPLYPFFLVLSLVTSRLMATVAFVSRIFTSAVNDEFFYPETIKRILDWTPLIAWFIIVSIFAYIFLFSFFEWIISAIILVIFWICFFGIMRWLWKTGLKREYEAQNPLSGIFQKGSNCRLIK